MTTHDVPGHSADEAMRERESVVTAEYILDRGRCRRLEERCEGGDACIHDVVRTVTGQKTKRRGTERCGNGQSEVYKSAAAVVDEKRS